MISSTVVILVSLAYVGLLFGIAWWGDLRAEKGRSLVNSPWVYALSITVYCTTWTFYGSVGYAARSGLEFLTIYFGPTIVFLGWWWLLRKMVRISKQHSITSIADFISSRYGKSTSLSVMVTLVSVLATTPYIALQLKAVSTSFTVLTGFSIVGDDLSIQNPAAFADTGFWVTAMLVIFAILFGTRHFDREEHHEGVVAAIAFESIVKLFALLAAGILAVFILHDGIGDLFETAKSVPVEKATFTLPDDVAPRWLTLILLSMAAIIALPRQFQMTVVENRHEDHLATASWAFPAYLLLMNIFVLPIALAGLALLPEGSDPDFFVISLPLAHNYTTLALFVFIGGLSAGTSMVIVTAIATSTMVCNDLVIPALLRIKSLRLAERGDLTGVLLTVRRFSIFFVLFLGYAYYRTTATDNALVSIGLTAFCGVAQLVPVMIGGIFWKGGSKSGAQTGLAMGFAIWFYTLLLPSFARAGWFDPTFISDGPFGISLLAPHALFGLGDMEPLTHALFWSMLFNIGGYVLVSVFSHQDVLERIQGTLFVDIYTRPGSGQTPLWRASTTVDDLYELVQRFLGGARTYSAFARYEGTRGPNWNRSGIADADTIAFAERLLASALGSASARILVSSVAKGEVIQFDEVMAMLEETSHVIEYSQQLEIKSKELEEIASELRAANERLQELDRLKDDFLTVVSHEFRTPLTSIRSFSEILVDNPDLDEKQSLRFLNIIARETERLTRLIDEHLDLARIEAGHMDWLTEPVDALAATQDAIAAAEGLFRDRSVKVSTDLESETITLQMDRDRLVQVILNLLSNAAKFSNADSPHVNITGKPKDGGYFLRIADNGPGIPAKDRTSVFDKFSRVGGDASDRPTGSGLGLAISQRVVEHFGGRIWVEDAPSELNFETGCAFNVFVPERT